MEFSILLALNTKVFIALLSMCQWILEALNSSQNGWESVLETWMNFDGHCSQNNGDVFCLPMTHTCNFVVKILQIESHFPTSSFPIQVSSRGYIVNYFPNPGNFLLLLIMMYSIIMLSHQVSQLVHYRGEHH